MKITATLTGGERPRLFKLSGRVGQTLFHLHQAGQAGITSLEMPALRLAAYIHSLRQLGFQIETEREPHDGDYPSRHARYRFASAVTLVAVQDGGNA